MRQSDQSAPQSAAPADKQTSRTAMSAGPEAALLELQRTAGNGAVQRMMIARDPAPGAGATASGTWQVRADIAEFVEMKLAPVSDRDTAAGVLGLVSARLGQLKESLTSADAAVIASAINGVESQRQKMAAGGPLSRSDIVDLDLVCYVAKSAFDTATVKLRQSIAEALDSLWRGFSAADTSMVEAELAEALHSAFTRGAPPELVAKAKSALATVQGYKGTVDRCANWAKKGADAVKAAKATELLEKFGSASKAFGELLGHAGSVLEAAELLYSLTSGHGGQTDAQASINDAKVFLKGLDLTVGAVAELCPIFGVLWNSYYKPLTEACLKAVQKLFDVQDREARLGSYFGVLGQWDSGLLQPPQLPPGNDPDTQKIRDKFPGGQPVLTFMYELVNGGAPQLTKPVEKFFVDHADLLNAGQDAKDRIKTQSNWEFLSPSTWGADDSSPNLMSFLQRHQATVWSQLYGALPHALRSGG